MTLTEFLRARIAEDEAIAREATPGTLDAPLRTDEATDRPGVVELAIDPARVLAECEAKRRIVAEHEYPGLDPFDAAELGYSPQRVEPKCLGCHDTYPCRTIRALTCVYADHPDYREEWKP